MDTRSLRLWSEQAELEAITHSQWEERENLRERVRIGFAFTSDWLRERCEYFISQSLSVVVKNRSKRKLYFRRSNENRSMVI